MHNVPLVMQIKDLEEDLGAKSDEFNNLLRDISESRHRSSRAGGISVSGTHYMYNVLGEAACRNPAWPSRLICRH